MAPPGKKTPHIDIIFLGSPGVGKATFLSRLPHVQHPSVSRRERLSATSARHPNHPDPPTKDEAVSVSGTQLPNDSQATLVEPTTTPGDLNGSQTTLVPPLSTPIPSLDKPLTFNVQLFSRPYSITIHASSSPIFIDPFPPNPDLLILTFSIPDRSSLFNVQHYWMPQYHLHYPTSTIPVLLLGLKRDLRTARTRTRTTRPVVADPSRTEGRDTSLLEEYESVMPEEGLQAAREMRVDRYAECSAETGELMWEATQDITKMAAGTTVDNGDYASEMCAVV